MSVSDVSDVIFQRTWFIQQHDGSDIHFPPSPKKPPSRYTMIVAISIYTDYLLMKPPTNKNATLQVLLILQKISSRQKLNININFLRVTFELDRKGKANNSFRSNVNVALNARGVKMSYQSIWVNTKCIFFSCADFTVHQIYQDYMILS